MIKKVITTISLLGILGFAAYFINSLLFTPPQPPYKKELLVYCGITLIKPMSEIASILEEREGIKISIIKGGSGNLLKSIRFNRIGDLYLPGSESYIKQANDEGLISESIHVGYNKAALMVRKGNPKKVKPDLSELLRPDLYVVLGNADSGSIGKETKKILSSAGLLENVMLNVRELTTDSKRLTDVINNSEADLVINWFAPSTWPENSNFIDTLPIDEQYANKKRLVLGLLSTAKYPKIARLFLDYASSKDGIDIFNRYGLYSVD
ncbi:MAG: substrate-binding domain-containing protein [Candidatus Thiodiazotropha sp. 6PLUC2]